MQHIMGIPRTQLNFGSLEEGISSDHTVRFIDAFSAQLDLVKIGFTVNTLKKEGRPSYQSSLFLYVFIYMDI